MDLLFLDVNVLFSAAYRQRAGLLRLWKRKGVQLITCDYAVEEARRNLALAGQRARLEELLRRVRIVGAASASWPPGFDLPAKDRPILLAAISAKANYLLTGDKKHFGQYFGRTVGGVIVLAPADYLNSLR